MISIALSKHQALDADPSVIQQINFIANLTEPEIQQCFSLVKKQKKLS